MCQQVDVLQGDGTTVSLAVSVVYLGDATAADNLVAAAEANLTDVDNLPGAMAAASGGTVSVIQVRPCRARCPLSRLAGGCSR